jgi:hypothetical protein
MEDWDLEPPQPDLDIAESRRQGLSILYEEEDRKLEAAIDAGERPVPLLKWLEAQAALGTL